ncbi:hypothetical protein L210DRAFT_3534907 [Boletus edulis BED1]|uniref:Uncharacterized protein n=1 Tax=Boletus edulis BED1 TaxID=1328754 RepID=A0AAD4BYZ7_BOLED|nr:hypothetical protein L210DRAFT_3579718 [Boletus edulis BED1]KAF8443129.1 hypothetical protein L210DRAFT_3534907 [Boletus edulis BED1]
MSTDELARILFERLQEDTSEDEDEPEEDEEFLVLKEEYYYRYIMESHETEIRAYERLKDLQGSAIPRLILAGQFLPPDERAIQPPALLFEYIPSISLLDITPRHLLPSSASSCSQSSKASLRMALFTTTCR